MLECWHWMRICIGLELKWIWNRPLTRLVRDPYSILVPSPMLTFARCIDMGLALDWHRAPVSETCSVDTVGLSACSTSSLKWTGLYDLDSSWIGMTFANALPIGANPWSIQVYEADLLLIGLLGCGGAVWRGCFGLTLRWWIGRMVQD